MNSGKWMADLEAAGNYEIFAYIPGDHATTTNASYRIRHHGENAGRTINQSLYQNEWVSLGIYYFDGSSDEFVTLGDNTGETGSSTNVVFDALKFVKR